MRKNKISLLLSGVLYITIWFAAFTVLAVAGNEGALSVFEDAFGRMFCIIAIIVVILSATSFIYLRLFIRRVKWVHVISYLLTFIVLITGLAFNIMGDKYFERFSTEKWIKYPQQRMTMYFDMINRNDITGCTHDQVESLLGKPDYITKEGTYVYDDRHGNEVYLEFEDKKVESIHYSE